MHEYSKIILCVCILSVCFFFIISNTTTPRRRLSLDMDENAQSPFTLEQDNGELCDIILGVHNVIRCMTPNNAHLLSLSPFLMQHCRLWW